MITCNRAKEIAYKAGAVQVDKVTSFLVHCDGDDDCRNSLRQLRSNDPELFLPDYRKGPKNASGCSVKMGSSSWPRTVRTRRGWALVTSCQHP